MNSTNRSTVQVFTGYLFTNCSTSSCTYTLAGSFTALAGAGGTAARHEFGWFAQAKVIS